ncbi:hypothetical protein LTR36_008920 [Oleoguttula mirabilis]|uniref:Uncharacterized protein n=1 Tax=Oleoguttula mirabilis TaxID=1507867 RepID=A0AAV9J727_9PEZI|nr:hypothetical protein LTR36_008920 [Oleoguttula mirabilis]
MAASRREPGSPLTAPEQDPSNMRQPPTIQKTPPALAASSNGVDLSTSGDNIATRPSPHLTTTAESSAVSQTLSQLDQLRMSLNGLRKLDVELLEKAFDSMVGVSRNSAGAALADGASSGIKTYYHEVMIVVLLQELEYDVPETMADKLRCFVAELKFKIDLKLQTILQDMEWSVNEVDNKRFTQPSKMFLACISAAPKNEAKHWSDINVVSTANGTDYKIPRICIGINQDDRGFDVVYLTDYENRGLVALRTTLDFSTHTCIYSRGARDVHLYDHREQGKHLVTRGGFRPLRNGSLVRLALVRLEYKQPIYPLDDELMTQSFDELTYQLGEVHSLKMAQARVARRLRDMKREGASHWPRHPAKQNFQAQHILIDRFMKTIPEMPARRTVNPACLPDRVSDDGSLLRPATVSIQASQFDDGVLDEESCLKRPISEVEDAFEQNSSSRPTRRPKQFAKAIEDGAHCGATNDVKAAALDEKDATASATEDTGTPLSGLLQDDESALTAGDNDDSNDNERSIGHTTTTAHYQATVPDGHAFESLYAEDDVEDDDA